MDQEIGHALTDGTHLVENNKIDTGNIEAD